MIIVRLNGGLGNQMFQYALGYHLAIKNQAALKLDLSSFENDKQRSYNLDCMNISASIASKMDLGKFLISKGGLSLRLLNQVKHYFSGFKVVKEINHKFEPAILETPDNRMLEGYWQSEKYFQAVSDKIRQEFSFKTNLTGQNLQTAELIQDVNAVSMHIRRGDYVTNPLTNQYHGTCDLDYYKKGIEIIVPKIENPYFFIFSDDPGWVNKNIKIDSPHYFVNHNSVDKGWADMQLMSLCKHHIIANSSFSWWGAWLSSNPSKIVIAPEKWFANEAINSSDLIPEKWVKI